MTNHPRLTIATLLLSAAAAAAAQSVWRCEDAGRVVYQGEPCHSGQGGRALDAAPTRPATAAAEAARIAAREQALAARLAAERREREAQPVALAAGILHPKTELSPPRKRPLRAQHPPKRDEAAGTWPATRPSSRQKPG